MSNQSKRLEAWIERWQVVKFMLEIESEIAPESQEIIDALVSMAED